MKTDRFREARRQNILALLEKYETLTVDALAAHFKVTGATIRTDFQALMTQNKVVRTRGSAMLLRRHPASPLAERLRTAAGAKRAIGRAAADLVAEGDIIGIDASSTALAMVPFLRERRRLTVVTHCLAVADEFMATPHIKVIMPGGQIKHESACMIGPGVVPFINTLRLNIAFMGARSMGLKEGLGEVEPDQAEIKKAFMGIAKKRVALADASKWDAVSLLPFAGWNRIDVLVSDSGLSRKARLALRKARVKVITAAEETAQNLRV